MNSYLVFSFSIICMSVLNYFFKIVPFEVISMFLIISWTSLSIFEYNFYKACDKKRSYRNFLSLKYCCLNLMYVCLIIILYISI